MTQMISHNCEPQRQKATHQPWWRKSKGIYWVNIRDLLCSNYFWQLWLVGVMLGLWLSFSVPAQAAPPEQGSNPQAQADVLLKEGLALYEQGDIPGALERFLTALPLIRSTGNQVNEATTLGNIGVAYLALGQPNETLTYLEQALMIWRQLGDWRGEATALSNLGSSHLMLGQPSEALLYLEQALTLHRQSGMCQ